ncbi:ATP-binding protein [Paucibacter sp. APW11]|uniref:histidine kinase n=1 Tax=Roseateles aquae TaxID=3077235 RepID=A0ABU3PCW9_9BURK|nr:ATP-binding protein [Paucibacter sp. APW11]MDT9000155.1 ATP-binding protein [Paucibacter sp. APW11]
MTGENQWDGVDSVLSAADDEEGLKQFRARMDAQVARVAAVLLGVVMLAALAHLASLAAMDDPWPVRISRMGTGTAVFMIAASSFLLAWRISVRVAACFFCSATMLTLVLLAAFYGNGLRSSGIPALIALTVVMGFMVGPKAAKWSMLGAMLGMSLLWFAQMQGWISGMHAGNTPPLTSYLVVDMVSCFLAGWLVLRYGTLYWDVSNWLERSRRLLADTLRAQRQSAIDLRYSEERWRGLLENSFSSIQIFDGKSGALRYANAQCLRKHGCQQLSDLSLSQLCPGGDFSLRQALRHVRRAVSEGEQYFQWRSRHRNGEMLWWDIKLDRMELDGRICAVAFAHDITARVEAERSLQWHQQRLRQEVRERTIELQDEKQRMQEIIEALPITLNIRDSRGRFILVNRMFERATGITREQVLGRTVLQAFGTELAQELAISDARLLAGGEQRSSERQLLREDGPHDYLVTAVSMTDSQGKPYAVLNLGTDVTSLKRLQRELSQAKDEAERLAQVKSDFLANMSHEIRTPLNAVLGLAQLGVQRASDARASADSFRRIVRAGGHLLGVINDVLDFSKLESGKLEVDPQPTQLDQLVQEVLDLVDERARAKDLPLRLERDAEVPQWLALDRLRVSQILLNLLSNAVKFTEHGEVRLQLQIEAAADGAAEAPQRLQFVVHDTGTGIAPDQQARIFNAFEQADSSTTRQFGGTGLGLSISRRLAQLMGGDIELQSVPGEGSRFTLSLPLVAAPPLHPPAADVVLPAETPASQPLRGLRLLVTDDVDINREILQDMLGYAGAEVVATDSGAQAVNRLSERGAGSFDAALMDVQMPDMDGYEATARLHQIDPDLPVIALTAHALPEQRMRCLAAGMCSHLSKPVDGGVLVQTVLVYAHRRRAARLASPIDSSPAPLQAVPELGNSNWPQVDGADFPAALQRCAGRSELLTKLLGAFAKQYSNHQSVMEEARIGGLMSLRSQAHRIKGVAGNLGLSQLAGVASELEQICAQAHAEEGDPSALPGAITALNRELGHSIAAIQAWSLRREAA